MLSIRHEFDFQSPQTGSILSVLFTIASKKQTFHRFLNVTLHEKFGFLERPSSVFFVSVHLLSKGMIIFAENIRKIVYPTKLNDRKTYCFRRY